jgi:hypothetical protein
MERWTMKELGQGKRTILLRLISERRGRCTNVYAPLYRRLTELYDWVETNVPDTPLDSAVSGGLTPDVSRVGLSGMPRRKGKTPRLSR